MIYRENNIVLSRIDKMKGKNIFLDIELIFEFCLTNQESQDGVEKQSKMFLILN